MTYPSVLFSVPDYVPPVLGTDSYTIPEANSRYFLTFPGVSQYVSIPEVTLTGDFEIEASVYFSGSLLVIFGRSTTFFETARINADGSIRWRPVGNSAQVLSPAGSVPVNRVSTLRFSRVGSSVTIYVNNSQVATGGTATASVTIDTIQNSGGVAGEGVVFNWRASNNGTPVRFYPLDDNSTTIRDTIGGNDGTYINGAASDWDLFTLGSDNIWVGPSQPVADNSGILGDDFDPEFFIAGTLREGISYRVSATVDTFSGTKDCGWSIGSTGGGDNGIPGSPPFRETAPAVGTVVGGDFTATITGDVRLFGRNGSVVSYRNISVRRLLEVS